MLLAHDVSGVHPLSCLSLSQREAIPSPGQIQRILGKSDGRGNLPGLHPIRPITVIRPSAFPTVGPPKFQSASRHKPAAVVSPNSWILASLRSKTLITNFPSPEQCCHLQATTAFEPVRPLGSGIAGGLLFVLLVYHIYAILCPDNCQARKPNPRTTRLGGRSCSGMTGGIWCANCGPPAPAPGPSCGCPSAWRDSPLAKICWASPASCAPWAWSRPATTASWTSSIARPWI